MQQSILFFHFVPHWLSQLIKRTSHGTVEHVDRTRPDWTGLPQVPTPLIPLPSVSSELSA
uniref:Uncharacterized protein n=1 Tax=Anguilla anguilla TaxID=7936 RepID=A0A0E9RAL1_ANGAN